MTARLAIGFVVGAALLAGCSDGERGTIASAGDYPPEWPRPTFETATIDVAGHPVTVELADDDAKRSYGMMFTRQSPPDDRGMLFLFAEVRATQAFWMRNTRIPLDIIYFGEDGRIGNAHRNATPLDESKTYPALHPGRYVLEMRGGWLEAHGVWIGDRIVLPPEVRSRPVKPFEGGVDIPRIAEK